MAAWQPAIWWDHETTCLPGMWRSSHRGLCGRILVLSRVRSMTWDEEEFLKGLEEETISFIRFYHTLSEAEDYLKKRKHCPECGL